MFLRAQTVEFAVVVAFTSCLVANPASGESHLPNCPSGSQFVSDYINNKRLSASMRKDAADQVKAAVGKKNNTNQTELPSIFSGSTSLVDESSASDLVGIAVNLLGVSTESPDRTSTSATVSAYAIKAALAGEEPLRPENYVRDAAWRRLSFAFGVDFPQESDDESERGVITGFKYLIYTERDISQGGTFQELDRNGHNLLAEATQSLLDAVHDHIETIVVPALCELPDGRGHGVDESKISAEDAALLDAALRGPGEAAVAYEREAQKLANQINERPQVAIEFLTNQRRQDGTDEYAGVVTADVGWDANLGFADKIAFTANGSYEYLDKKLMADSQGGKVGAQFRFLPTQELITERVPWIASLAADARWLTNQKPRYRVQAKFTIALFDGVNLPLSVSWASTSEFNEEEEVLGNVGFTFDTAKLLARLAQ